jgi:hypothetical protein
MHQIVPTSDFGALFSAHRPNARRNHSETTQRKPMWVAALSCDCDDRAAGR